MVKENEMKKAKWQRGLKVSEINHLAEGSATGRASLTSLKRNLAEQERVGIHCFECRSIALKLGLKVAVLS
jgi:hypothetical protein